MNFLRQQPHHNKVIIVLAMLVWASVGFFFTQRVFAAVSVVSNNSAAPDTVFPGQNTPATPGEMYSVGANGNNDGDTANFDLDWKDGNVPNNVSFVWDSAQDVFGDHDWSEFFAENEKNIVTVTNYLRIKSSLSTSPGTYQFRIKVTECSPSYHNRQCPAGSSSAYTAYMYFYVADYSVSITPPTQTVSIGQTSGPYTVTITGNYNFADDAARTVNLTLQNLPSDAVVRWSDGGTTASTTMTVNLGQSSATKTFTLASSIEATTNFSVQGSFGYSDGNGQPQTMTRTTSASLTVQSTTFLLSLPDGNIAPIWTGQSTTNYKIRVMAKAGFTGGAVTLSIGWNGTTPDGVTLNWEGGTNTVIFPANPPENTYIDKKVSISTTTYDPQNSSGTAGATYPFTITGMHQGDLPVEFSNENSTLVVGDWILTAQPAAITMDYNCYFMDCAPKIVFGSQKVPADFPWGPNFHMTFSGIPENADIRMIQSNNTDYHIYTYNVPNGVYTITATNNDSDTSNLIRSKTFTVTITGAPQQNPSVTVNPTNLIVDNLAGAKSDMATVSIYPGDYTGAATVQLNWWDAGHSPGGKLIGLWGDGGASEPFPVNLTAHTTTNVAMQMQLSSAIDVNNYVYDIWVKKSDGTTLYGGNVSNVISVRQPDDSDRNIAITLVPDPNDVTHKKYNGTVKNNGTKSRSVKLAASANQPGIIITASPLIFESLQPGMSGATAVTVNWTNTVTCGTYEVHLQEFGYIDPDAMANIEVTDGCAPPPAEDFDITTVTPNPLTLDPNSSGSYTVTIQRLNGFTGDVKINWTAVPTP